MSRKKISYIILAIVLAFVALVVYDWVSVYRNLNSGETHQVDVHDISK